MWEERTKRAVEDWIVRLGEKGDQKWEASDWEHVLLASGNNRGRQRQSVKHGWDMALSFVGKWLRADRIGGNMSWLERYYGQ